jgi:hypothetical protein
MLDETVEHQVEPIEQIVEAAQAEQNEVPESVEHEEPQKKTMIPLSVAQKLREQKRELELELQWERQRNAQIQQQAQKPVEEDSSRYESATREEVARSQNETIRAVEERLWIKANPEKFEYINEHLPKFLKQRPNLTTAIDLASNRYEEAFELMDKLTPKQKQQLVKPTQSVKKDAPNSPSAVPKAAALNEAVDVMSMSDSEFMKWKQSKKVTR